jgi:flagellar biosynthesis chaperone FliJ
MAWNINKILASGIIIGGVTIGTLTFTGSDDLTSIRNTVQDFKNRIMNLNNSLQNYKTAFNSLKADATAKIQEANDKIAEKNSLIASLQAQIADLQNQIAEGAGNADILRQEIERLNAELTKANQEIEALEAEVTAYKNEVNGIGDTVETAPDTTLPTVEDSAPASEPSEPDTETPTEPADTTFNINDWFNASQQQNLTAMKLMPITDIGVHNNGTIEFIYIRTSNTSFDGNALTLQQQDYFKNNIVPVIENKLGVSGKQIRFFTDTANLNATGYSGGWIAVKNNIDSIKKVTWQ